MIEFEVWYQMERPRILAACLALSGDLDAATDATDEAFTRALERWPRVAAMESPGGWTQTVALNVLRRVLRGRRRPVSFGGVGHAAAGVPDAELWSVVGELPHRQQMAVVLRYVHDLTQEQVAACMGISRGGVASTLAAAKANLARRLDDREMEEEKVDG